MLLSVLLLATTASAHTIFQKIYVNGASPGHKVGVRVVNSNNPIMDVSTNDIICNGINQPFLQPVSQTVVSVPAGGKITTEWHHGIVDGMTPGDSDDPIASSHKGPVITYLAKVTNATQSNVTGLKWFKIFQDGLNVSAGTWGVDRLIAASGKATFTIPSCLAPGQYIMRHEIIALHGAGSYPGAQFYVGCAQIAVTGSGTTTPSSTVSFPGAYKGSDPGITIGIYYPPLTGYTIPGPSVFTC